MTYELERLDEILRDELDAAAELLEEGPPTAAELAMLDELIRAAGAEAAADEELAAERAELAARADELAAHSLDAPAPFLVTPDGRRWFDSREAVDRELGRPSYVYEIREHAGRTYFRPIG